MTLYNIHLIKNIPQSSLNSNFLTRNKNVFLFKYPCLQLNKCSLISVTFPPGVFRLECWGASGGNRGTQYDDGGRGAYTRGDIAFSDPTTLFFSIGASGVNNTNGTYGGGGHIHNSGSKSGGGATDIRLHNNEKFLGLKKLHSFFWKYFSKNEKI